MANKFYVRRKRSHNTDKVRTNACKFLQCALLPQPWDPVPSGNIPTITSKGKVCGLLTHYPIDCTIKYHQSRVTPLCTHTYFLSTQAKNDYINSLYNLQCQRGSTIHLPHNITSIWQLLVCGQERRGIRTMYWLLRPQPSRRLKLSEILIWGVHTSFQL